jgi:hypothetical protein
MMNTNTVCVPSKETQVSREVNFVAGNLDELEMEINELEKKLEAITTPLISTPTKIEKQAEALVVIAQTFKSFGDRVKLSAQRIRELRNRIEL